MKAYLLLLCLAMIVGCQSPPLPEFKPPDSICPKTDLLLLAQPEIDIKSGNSLIAVYCKNDITPSGSEWEVSLVFEDEIHPNSWKDFFYRIYRRIKYGRNYDIESFTIRLEPDGRTFQLDLKNVYSGSQNFYQDPVEHKDSVLASHSLENKNSVPVVYINTWNHMFGEKDTNPDLQKQEHLLSEFRFGSRRQLDLYFGSR
ncbi:hypothetical protein EHO59_12585 [Leptospira semungkisensis]|uniref:Lipoprotein n=1 Tax=Leptospira semungkisensis TaxID=2484985 RepID=A0A4R9FQN2_9LEPT|nr:hypothetical protein [Leptospira semungkisensis]TGK01112.1 hypothetical protein EHO59_12585 [Leptospira semungkisensis]